MTHTRSHSTARSQKVTSYRRRQAAAYSVVPLVPSASSSQSVPEEVRAKLWSEQLLNYAPSFCGFNSSVQAAKETERQNGKETQDVTENAQSGYRRHLSTPRFFEGIPCETR
jgi:hypothetical protein